MMLGFKICQFNAVKKSDDASTLVALAGGGLDRQRHDKKKI